MTDNVKVSKFETARKNIVKFLKEVRSELKKVIWPSRQQLINNTLTVLLSCAVIGAVIWIADFGLEKVVKLIFLK